VANKFHKDSIDDDNHALTAVTYADIAARDADTSFQVTENLNKMVRVDSPASYYILTSLSPTVWLEASSTETDTFLELTDTPSSYSGEAGNVLQVNSGETAVEFGQALRTTDNPQFTDLTLTGDLTVQGTTTTIDTTTLLVEDKNIEIGVVTTPTDVTADGGGITLKGATDKTIIWVDSTDSWNFNQDVLTSGHATIGALTSPPTDVSLDLAESDKAFLPNQGTTTERDAITAIEGMHYYNLTNNDMEFFNGVAWQSMGAGDVVGPASSVIDSVPTFSTTGGKNIQDPNIMFISGGNVGIGDSAPGSKLDVNGDINISAADTGYKIDDNTVLFASDTTFDTLVGVGAGATLTSGGTQNTAVGFQALNSEVTADNNTAIGYQALFSHSGSVGLNTAVGAQALFSNLSGTVNTAIGRRALFSSLASNNTAVGTDASQSSTTGTDNTAVGLSALNDNIVGNNNAALGETVLSSSLGDENTALGSKALEFHTTGDSQTALGFFAGAFISGGVTQNVLSSTSVYLGAETEALASGDTNEIVIGFQTTGIGSNTVTLGNGSIITTALKGNVGIKTTSPNQPFHVRVSGTSNFTGGSKRGILITDSAGPYLIFEETVAPVDEKVIVQRWESGVLSFNTTNDSGSSFIKQSILTIKGSTGNVGIGISSASNPLTVSGAALNSQGPMRIVSTVPGIIFEETDSGSSDAFQIVVNNEQLRIQRNVLSSGSFVSNLVQIDVDGKIGINSDPDANAQVIITDPSQSDGDEYLRLNTERAWVFKQLGSGSSASLELQSDVDSKNFIISSPAGKSLATFRVSDSLPDDHQATIDGKFLAKDFNRNTVYFTSEADLPAPSGGVITLQENTVYIMFNDDPTTSQKVVTLTNRIQIPDAGGVRITGVGLATAILLYTGTGNFITTSSSFTGFLHIDELFLSCPNGTIFDIDGVLPVGSEFFPRIFLSNFGAFDTDTVGTVKTISVNFNVGAFFDCKQGLILDGVDEFLIGDWRWANWQNDVGSIMLTAKNQLRFPKIQNCTFETNANEAAFNVSPSIGDETFIIGGNSYRGDGVLYATGAASGVISDIEIATLGVSGSVTVVSGTPFGESIMTDVAHGLAEGQIITTSGFADSNYNGTFEVLEVIDLDNFRIHALFGATDTGSWVSDVITVVTASPHGLSKGDGFQITDTNDYNGGTFVLFLNSSTRVRVNKVFSGAETGNFNTDSLTETDPRMRVVANAGIPDSQVIASGAMNANANSTTVTDSIYAAIDVTGTTENTATQRFVLTDAAAGEFTYIGQEDLASELTAVISATKTGSTANYRFAISVNGAVPVFASASYAPMEVKTDKISTTLLKPVNVVTDDTIQIMVAGDGTGDDITITDLSMEIRGD